MRLALHLLLCLFFSQLSHASDFTNGLAAYEAGDFKQAIIDFNNALKNEPETAALRHNLALAYFQNEQPAEAVWQLERAQRLAPMNHEIIGKLQLLKQQLNLPQSDLPWYQSLARLLSLQQWTLLASVLFWIAVGCLVYGAQGSRSRNPVPTFVGYILLLFLGFSVVCAYLSYQDQQTGIVISAEAHDLNAAPASAAPAISRVSPGESARVIDRHEAFVKIKTPSGALGWIHSEHFRQLYH